MAFTPSQDAFRYYNDGTESGSAAIEGQDANVTLPLVSDTDLHLRVRIQGAGTNDGGGADDYRLQSSKNGETYTNITASSANVKGFNSGSLTEGEVTTQRLSAGSGTFEAGKVSEDGLVDNEQIRRDEFTELLYSLTLVAADLVGGDTIDFRVLHNGATMTYNVTPRITKALSWVSSIYPDFAGQTQGYEVVMSGMSPPEMVN